MANTSLLQDGAYTLGWVKDFYTQTGIWWGPHIQSDKAHAARLDMIDRLCGEGPLRILELGSGPGETAARLADKGHEVVGVELNPTDAAHAALISRTPRPGSFTAIQADWYTVQLDDRFDVICCWEAFGLGSDSDQRRLLHRIAREWLAPGGSALLDVYCPFAPAKDAGVTERLPPLPGVPGSVEMNRRSYFDPIECRWIEEWEPTQAPEKALAQTVRCYSPADFLLLLEGTGLCLKRLEVGGSALDFGTAAITRSGTLMTAYDYQVQLALAAKPAAA